MSYELDAFIGPLNELKTWQIKHSAAVVFPLTGDLGLVPLTADLHLSMKNDADAWALEASEGTTIARVQASYFGGIGSQSATVSSDGEVVVRDAEVNEALRRLGVQASKGSDEWDTVGLGRFRKTARWAARALVPEAGQKDAVPELITMLRYNSTDRQKQEMTRSSAATELGKLGPAAAAAIPALERIAAGTAEYGVRISAAAALAQIGGGGIAALVELLATPEKKDLKGWDHDQWLWPIVYCLGDAGLSAAPAVNALARLLLQHRDWRIRVAAAQSLARIGPAAAPAAPALAQALHDTEPLVRPDAAEALGLIGPAARGAVSVLVRDMTDPASTIRGKAARSLVQIGEQIDETVIPALIDMLPNIQVSATACELLGGLGPRAAVAVPALAATLRHPSEFGRQATCAALGKIGGDRAVQALREATRDEYPSVRRTAAETLAALPPDGRTVPALRALLDDPVPHVRLDAARLLIAVGELDERALVPVLVQLLESDFSQIAAGSAALLGQLGPRASAAVRALIKALSYPVYDSVRAASMAALASIGGEEAARALTTASGTPPQT